MKLSYLLFSVVVTFLSITVTRAQIILAPGEEEVLTNYPATGGEDRDNGWPPGFNVDHDHDVNSKTVKAQVNSIIPIPNRIKVEAYALIYYDFQISATNGTNNNTIATWISYDVLWQGYQTLTGIASWSYNQSTIEIILKDRTTNQLVKQDIVHDHNLHQYSFDFVAAGFNIDQGSTANNYSLVLKRGHTYRLHMRLTSVMLAGGTGSSNDYMDGLAGGGEGRVQLTNLFVKVGLDDKETLQKLASVDSLENRIDSLEYRLKHHHHTGKGKGHNNTEANSTLSIFEKGNISGITSRPSFEPGENYIPNETVGNKSIPDNSFLGQNYPNPFNPSTKIFFAIPKQEFVTIKVFDILGRQVKVLMNEVKTPGYYEINFDAGKLPSGTYIYQLEAGSFTETKKMILMK